MDRRRILLLVLLLGAGWLACASWVSGLLFVGFSVENLQAMTVRLWWEYVFEYWPTAYRPSLIDSAVRGGGYTALAIGLFGALVLWPRQSLHGSARFSNFGEISAHGLTIEKGIVIGKFRGRILRLGKGLSALLTAPTGSGKGVSIVIPNLMEFYGSVVCNDLKLENWRLTSLIRRLMGQEVHLFDPFDVSGKSSRYNPLGFLSEDASTRVSEIASIAENFYPSGDDKEIWPPTARNLFSSIALYLCETPTLPCTFGEMLRQGSGMGRPLREHLDLIVVNRNFVGDQAVDDDGKPIVGDRSSLRPRGPDERNEDGLLPLSEHCIVAINNFLGSTGNTSSSIGTTFLAPLSLWANPLVDRATSACDFDLRKLRTDKISIYLGIRPNRVRQASTLLNLFFSQVIDLNTDEMLGARPDLKHPVLLLLDELPRLGYMPALETAVSLARSYGVLLLTVVQSEAQLRVRPPRGFGPELAKTMVSDHGVRIIHTPQSDEDAKEYSTALGDQTVKSVSRHLRNKFDGTESEARRPLMLPQEIKLMPNAQQMIAARGLRPIKCSKLFYYKERKYVKLMRKTSRTLGGRFRFGSLSETQLRLAMDRKELECHVEPIDNDVFLAQRHSRYRAAVESDVVKPVGKKPLTLGPKTMVAGAPAIVPHRGTHDEDEIFDVLAASLEKAILVSSAAQLSGRQTPVATPSVKRSPAPPPAASAPPARSTRPVRGAPIDDGPFDAPAPSAEDLGCDPETGEVLEPPTPKPASKKKAAGKKTAAKKSAAKKSSSKKVGSKKSAAGSPARLVFSDPSDAPAGGGDIVMPEDAANEFSLPGLKDYL